jgi:hypothetical protein
MGEQLFAFLLLLFTVRPYCAAFLWFPLLQSLYRVSPWTAATNARPCLEVHEFPSVSKMEIHNTYRHHLYVYPQRYERGLGAARKEKKKNEGRMKKKRNDN